MKKTHATYVCRCGDGINRTVDGYVEEQVDHIVARARSKFPGAIVEDLIDEIVKGRTEGDEDDYDEDKNEEEGESEGPESLEKNADPDPPRAFMSLLAPKPSLPAPVPAWKDEAAREKRPHEPAVYVVAFPSGRRTVRGFLDEPLSHMLRRANKLHHLRALSVMDEVPI